MAGDPGGVEPGPLSRWIADAAARHRLRFRAEGVDDDLAAFLEAGDEMVSAYLREKEVHNFMRALDDRKAQRRVAKSARALLQDVRRIRGQSLDNVFRLMGALDRDKAADVLRMWEKVPGDLNLIALRAAHLIRMKATFGPIEALAAACEANASDLDQWHAYIARQRGRPAKAHASEVAGRALRFWESRHGRRATITVDPVTGEAGGEFLAFLAQVFDKLDISASPEATARAAIKRARDKGE